MFNVYFLRVVALYSSQLCDVDVRRHVVKQYSLVRRPNAAYCSLLVS